MPSPEAKPERALGMRRIALVRAGYGEAAAAELAARPEVDLDRAVALLKEGVEPETARAMLLAGDGPAA